MADKPLARRLDIIEDKLDNFIDNQDKLIEAMGKFESALTNFSSIDSSTFKKNTRSVIGNTAEDWATLADYCIENEFDASEVMKIMRIFTGDFRKDKK